MSKTKKRVVGERVDADPIIEPPTAEQLHGIDREEKKPPNKDKTKGFMRERP